MPDDRSWGNSRESGIYHGWTFEICTERRRTGEKKSEKTRVKKIYMEPLNFSCVPPEQSPRWQGVVHTLVPVRIGTENIDSTPWWKRSNFIHYRTGSLRLSNAFPITSHQLLTVVFFQLRDSLRPRRSTVHTYTDPTIKHSAIRKVELWKGTIHW